MRIPFISLFMNALTAAFAHRARKPVYRSGTLPRRVRGPHGKHMPAGTKLAREAAAGMCTLRFGRPMSTRKLDR